MSFTIGMATQRDVDGWYAGLARPPLTPPNIALPIMWSILYALIGSGFWFCSRRVALAKFIKI